MFADVSDSDVGCKDGFSGGIYGPEGAVLRARMAKLLANTYRLTLR